MRTIAILYQADPSPSRDGVQKPMKPGGYSDSGADIACELRKWGVRIVTPVHDPQIETDMDWVFPDTLEGIQKAVDKGANTLWLNTVLYEGHSITRCFDQGLRFVGQKPHTVEMYDDKYFTNELLCQNQIPIPKSHRLSIEELADFSLNIDFPLVVKPIRGRGSQGVSLVDSREQLDGRLRELFSSKEYGTSFYVEEFLSGQEITVTVMPSGGYSIDGEWRTYCEPWCLPAVRRFNHINGVAPYNGVVAVMENSTVLGDDELAAADVTEAYRHCIHAAQLLKISAPIRIDCRADRNGEYFLFDLNMKPNMTGPSRAHRQDQDSLTLLAARRIGWDYIDLLNNMLGQAWSVQRPL